MWQRIKRGQYSERMAARLVREVLRAVAQCHAKGVIVRDVKVGDYYGLGVRVWYLGVRLWRVSIEGWAIAG